jgi:hypothetical protein
LWQMYEYLSINDNKLFLIGHLVVMTGFDNLNLIE